MIVLVPAPARKIGRGSCTVPMSKFAVALNEKKRMWMSTSTEATRSTVPVPAAWIVALIPAPAIEKPKASTSTLALKWTPNV